MDNGFKAIHIVTLKKKIPSAALSKRYISSFAYLIIIVVIITWPEKIDFVLVPEHDVIGILT